MKLTLKAYTIYELGQRANQEDAIFPKHGAVQDTDRLFILCDGMGGHESGEVASSTVCAVMSRSVLRSLEGQEEPEFTQEMLLQALDDAYDALDQKDNGADKKMGTTMTFLKFHRKGCTIAHIGDSRVYHIRPGKDAADTQILFQTRDHSLVNDLIDVGELTPEEAKTFRQKNVITRAMQPNMDRRCKADIQEITDIRPGDYFYMCSDGMLEEMEEEHIRFNFSAQTGSDENKIRILVEATSQNQDNHSAIVVHILDVEGGVSDETDLHVQREGIEPKPIMAEVHDEEADADSQKSDSKKTSADDGFDGSELLSGKKPWWWIFFVILLLLIGGGVYSYQKGLLGGNRQPEEPQNEILSPDSGHAPRRGGKKTKPGSGRQPQTNPNDSGAVVPETAAQQPTETATASQTTDSSQNSVQQTVEAVSATASSGDAGVVSSDEQAVQDIMQNKQN